MPLPCAAKPRNRLQAEFPRDCEAVAANTAAIACLLLVELDLSNGSPARLRVRVTDWNWRNFLLSLAGRFC